MDVLTIVLIAALVVAFIVIVSLARRQNADSADGSILSTLVGWLTTYAMRWNKLVVALLLFAVFRVMATELKPNVTPPEVWWFAAGAIITGLIGWMLSPDPSKSEVLTLAERNIEREAERDALVPVAIPYEGEPDRKE